ncbi:MAG: exodeoxyribonuclease VII large subunit [Methanophagales archaeon ANME-1-THS]|nr:MAG: exodeoxyribonuclease VII large subunit [Methanophagales archaeon ANME-1-THS]
MNKPRKGITLLDFLHLKEDEDEEKGEVERKQETEIGIEEEKGVEAPHIYTVQEVTRYIRQRLDEDEVLADIYVKGELSNLSQPTSGHVYFTIKDEFSELQCVMFRERNHELKFTLEDGLSVVVRGRISVYEKRGRYQMYVEEVQEAGLGALYLAFEQLKRKLKDEGLFDAVYKKLIPSFPSRIGIITSPTGAAIRDMLKILKKRFPHVHILLAPVAVQGAEAPAQIIRAIQLMNRYSAEREQIDVLIVGRGGGSIEELWAFNEEAVAREIFASVIPVISAVGHETDFTIADFVADKRAATPSEAAELVVPDRRELERNVRSLELRMRQNLFKAIEYHRKRLEGIEKSIWFRKPIERINQYRQTLDELKRSLVTEITHLVALQRKSVQALMGKLDALSPLAILERGYCISLKVPDGVVVRSIQDISVGDALKVLFKDGAAISEVRDKKIKKRE